MTFGDTQIFKVRHKSKKDISPLDVPLTHGSLLLMGIRCRRIMRIMCRKRRDRSAQEST
ncbi:hypothetical protein [Pedobacter sp. GR22-6]|uniref:hypothetical protein n=1 Tax=Pedobacter sp. GR22-6 TaxID=3127957 RepID=UPI003FCE7458